jgi:hypothetical protein
LCCTNIEAAVEKKNFVTVAQLSSSAESVNSRADESHRAVSTFGWQQTWQSSTYCCFDPPDSSTVVSIHSPQPAH